MNYGQRCRVALIGVVIAVLFLLLMYSALALAAFLALWSVLNPVAAALIVALGCLIGALVTLLVVQAVLGRRRSAGTEQQREAALDTVEASLQAHLDPLLSTWGRRYPLGATALALGVGVAAGRSRAVRDLLRDVYETHSEHDPDGRRRDRGDH